MYVNDADFYFLVIGAGGPFLFLPLSTTKITGYYIQNKHGKILQGGEKEVDW